MKKLFFSLFLIILSSCSTNPSQIISVKNKNTSLTNTHWILEDSSISTIPHTITLCIEHDKISGNASCNNYFGTLKTDISGNFEIENIGATRKNCHKMNSEQYFLNLLEKVNKYQSTSQNLELYQDNILLLKFRKKITLTY